MWLLRNRRTIGSERTPHGSKCAVRQHRITEHSILGIECLDKASALHNARPVSLDGNFPSAQRFASKNVSNDCNKKNHSYRKLFARVHKKFSPAIEVSLEEETGDLFVSSDDHVTEVQNSMIQQRAVECNAHLSLNNTTISCRFRHAKTSLSEAALFQYAIHNDLFRKINAQHMIEA